METTPVFISTFSKKSSGGKWGEPCFVLFGVGDSVDLYHFGGKPGMFRSRKEVRDGLF